MDVLATSENAMLYKLKKRNKIMNEKTLWLLMLYYYGAINHAKMYNFLLSKLELKIKIDRHTDLG